MIENTVFVNVKKKWFYRRQGFTFDMYTWCYMSSYTQLALSDFDQLGDRFVIVAYYSAAVSYCRASGKKVRFTEDDVKVWFDNMTQKEAKSILDCMMSSRIGGETLSDLADKAEKKNNS